MWESPDERQTKTEGACSAPTPSKIDTPVLRKRRSEGPEGGLVVEQGKTGSRLWEETDMGGISASMYTALSK